MYQRGIRTYKQGAKRKSKYGNHRCEMDGFTFDSKHEMFRYSELKLLLRAGEISDLELQKPFELQEAFIDADGVRQKPIYYRADFVYKNKDGKMIIEDAKSEATRKDKVYRMKKKMMAYKGLMIREV